MDSRLEADNEAERFNKGNKSKTLYRNQRYYFLTVFVNVTKEEKEEGEESDTWKSATMDQNPISEDSKTIASGIRLKMIQISRRIWRTFSFLGSGWRYKEYWNDPIANKNPVRATNGALSAPNDLRM